MNDTSDLFLPLVATSAAFATVSLVLLQTDIVSRKILDPAQLNRKRRSEYIYTWKKAVDKAKLQLDYCLAGDVEKYNHDPEIVMKNTEYISNDDDLSALAKKIVDKKDELSKFYTLKLDRDPYDPTDDLYLYMVKDEYSSSKRELLQVPLIEFGTKLAEAFENQPTTTTFCFVADASAGKATKILESLVKESKAGVAVLSEPFWMIQFARLVEASIVAPETIRKLFFALCRLDAMSARREVGCADTVVLTLPGQAVVATLLPLLRIVFPRDRCVFAYDGCVASVERGIYAELLHRRGQVVPDLEPIIRGMCDDPVRKTTPLPSNSPLSHDPSLGGGGGTLERALARVPLRHARNIEAWLSSIDAFFKLKSGEATDLPYFLKLGRLTDNPVGNFESGTESHSSLKAVLQHVTGCRDGALPEEGLDAAKEWLKDHNAAQAAERTKMDRLVRLSERDRAGIESCCFQHRHLAATAIEAGLLRDR
mmetsp:Transcript_26540/g.62366  ORF Transcript_26540/g.62366 Transcript_26540/m.62366 type:complete len:481 (+) Transcript_26540:156-1598(+)